MNNEMAASTTIAEISDFETRNDKKKIIQKEYTAYKIYVTSNGIRWFVFRRYTEFNQLYAKLKKSHPKLKLRFPKWSLTSLSKSLDPEFISKRREALGEFVQQLTTEEELLIDPFVQEFLELTGKPVGELLSPERDDPLPIIPEQKSSSDGSPDSIKKLDLGPSEKRNAKPSDFEFMKVIGKGTFGKVLLAQHKEDLNYYAVKVLQKTYIIRRNEVQHIMSERNAMLKTIEHPFIVTLNWSFQTNEKLYFVLEYVSGGELFFHLTKERIFAEPRAKFYAAEMASAIGYLHTNDIIYRDLKPENILLDITGHIKLTDFGLCKDNIQPSEKTYTICGTPEYLAPEVIRKQPYNFTVDWWCLGSVLYEMLYGLPPFYNKDIKKMNDAKLTQELKFTGISKEAKLFLKGLLNKDGKERLGATSDFLEIKNHCFFSAIDWDKLYRKEIDAPYKPPVESSTDVKCFDSVFTREPVPGSVGRSVSASVGEADSVFNGFSYVAPGEVTVL